MFHNLSEYAYDYRHQVEVHGRNLKVAKCLLRNCVIFLVSVVLLFFGCLFGNKSKMQQVLYRLLY